MIASDNLIMLSEFIWLARAKSRMDFQRAALIWFCKQLRNNERVTRIHNTTSFIFLISPSFPIIRCGCVTAVIRDV